MTTKQFSFVQNVKYCDTNQFDLNCLECPENSVCKNGLVIDCSQGYILANGDVCINNNQKETLIMKMYILSFDLIADNNGTNLCQGSSKRLYFNEVVQHLQEAFKDEKNFDSAISTFKNNFKNVFVYELDDDRADSYFLSNRVILSSFCRLKLFVVYKTILFLFLLVLGLVLLLLLLRELRINKQRNLAEILYKCIMIEIKKKDKVSQ